MPRSEPHTVDRVEPVAARRSGWLFAAWLASLVAALWLFTAVGDGALATPPLADPGALSAWAAARAPVEIAFAGMRLLVLALAWYLLGMTTIGAVARLTRAVRLVAVADALTVPAVRRLLQGALGVGLAAAAVASVSFPPTTATAPGAADQAHTANPGGDGPEAGLAPHLPAWARGDLPADAPDGLPPDAPDGLPPGAPDGLPPRAPDGLPSDAPARLPEQGTEPPTNPDPDATGDPGPSDTDDPASPETPADAGDAEAAPGDRWQVASGEHLWGIAAAALAAAWEEAPTDGEVHGYWKELIALNRPRLPDPGNPDLIHPGLILELPAPPASAEP